MARKILLADDSVTAQNMGRKILADAGYDVVTVNNGSAALKRIAEIKPDLIVLDVYMPGYSGLEVCQRLKDAEGTAHIPVLLTVGKLEPFKAEEARRVRAEGHIVKPFEASELLTAITRLEDRMVPQQSEATRFSSSVSGVERFGGETNASRAQNQGRADGDTGWMSRLRFPSKKKKEEREPESENSATDANLGDLRKTKGTTSGSRSFTVKAPVPPGQEPGLVPDIPRDITPEELDALSELVSKLDGPIPEAEGIAPLADTIGPVESLGTEAASRPEVAGSKVEKADGQEADIKGIDAGKVEAEVPALAAEAPQAEAPQREENTDIEIPASGVESTVRLEASAEEAGVEKNEVKIPVESETEPAAVEASPVAEGVTQHEIEQREDRPTEIEHAEMTGAVNTALFASAVAPVDRDDEPMFASMASAMAQPVGEVAEQEIGEEKSIEHKIVEEKSGGGEIEGKAVEAVAQGAGTPEISPESRSEKLEIEKTAQTNASGMTEPEETTPSDEELAEALRLLTPASGHSEVSTFPSHGTLLAAGRLLVEEAARNAAGGLRWVAEPMALTPEEAATSLEAEMFRTYATMAVSTSSVPMPGEHSGATQITGVSAIAAAVENRLASLELAANTAHNAEETAAEVSSGQGTPVEAPAALAMGASAVSSAMNRFEAQPAAAAQFKTDQKDFRAKVTEEEDAAAATFAEAGVSNGVAAHVEQNGELVCTTTVEAADKDQDTSPDAGGQESMGEDMKTKSGKSNWHQIRTAPAKAATPSEALEAAKQSEAPVAEEASKAMAAAATEGSASASVMDASAIASIVDSVMADLRPKIVEEIARKLAGK